MDNGVNGDYVDVVGLTTDNLNRTVVITEGVSKSRTYRLRYRVRNEVGWSAFSEPAYILASQTPSQPAAPTLTSVSATDIVLAFTAPEDNGGDILTGYELFQAIGTGSHSLVSTYTDNSLAHTLTLAANSLVAGQYYRYKIRAINAAGYSDFSEELRVALSELPDQPSAPSKDDSLSSSSTIMVTWTAVANEDVPTLGYYLYMDGGNNGEYELVFDGKNQPGITQYLVSGLEEGRAYRFKVAALNYNGLSTESDESVLYACLPPAHMALPTYKSSTETTLTLQWIAPTDTNGCPLTGYELYIDDGAGGDITTLVDTYEPQEIEGTATLTGADTSKTYRFQIYAYNDGGFVQSGIASFILANVPDTPSAPTYEATQTNED